MNNGQLARRLIEEHGFQKRGLRGNEEFKKLEFQIQKAIRYQLDKKTTRRVLEKPSSKTSTKLELKNSTSRKTNQSELNWSTKLAFLICAVSVNFLVMGNLVQCYTELNLPSPWGLAVITEGIILISALSGERVLRGLSFLMTTCVIGIISLQIQNRTALKETTLTKYQEKVFRAKESTSELKNSILKTETRLNLLKDEETNLIKNRFFKTTKKHLAPKIEKLELKLESLVSKKNALEKIILTPKPRIEEFIYASYILVILQVLLLLTSNTLLRTIGRQS